MHKGGFGRSLTRMPYKNRSDQLDYARRWYKNNRQRVILSNGASAKRVRDVYHEIKAGSRCLSCNENDPDCLTFHHRNPAEKSFSLGEISTNKVGKPALLREIKKCDCLCSNCHMKLEARIRREGPTPQAPIDRPLPLFDVQ